MKKLAEDKKWCQSLGFRLGFVSELVKRGYDSSEIGKRAIYLYVTGPEGLVRHRMKKEAQLSKFLKGLWSIIKLPPEVVYKSLLFGGLGVVGAGSIMAGISAGRKRRARRKLKEREINERLDKILNEIALARAYHVAAMRLALAEMLKKEREAIQAERSRRSSLDKIEIL